MSEPSLEADVATSPSGFEKPIFPVLIAGIGTTLLTLAGLFFLNIVAPDLNIMGWYAKYIIPVGALLVGAVAASGYGIASYYTGIKISKGLLGWVLVLQLLAYGVAQYIEFKSLGLVYEDGQSVGFFTYYDVATRAMSFKPRHGSGDGSALGAWGYGIRALELVGFGLGSLIVPGALSALPFCDRCQRYKKTRTLLYLPASVKGATALFKNKDQKVAEAEQSAEVFTQAQAQVAEMNTLIDEGRGDTLLSRLQAARAESKAAASLPQRISVELITCPSCGDGEIKWVMFTGQGRDVQRTELGTRTLSSDLARSLLSA